MALEVNGTEIATNEKGYLEDVNDWNEDVAKALAAAEGIELGDKHWDVINYLREEYLENRGNQPNTRTIIKAMSAEWGEKIKSSDLYALFPLDPSKQGGMIAGLPESRRKGGY